jgi:mRNA-degrading endonuclease RelE of RelBE toxin-antitoxin system
MSWTVTIKKKQIKNLAKLPVRVREAFLALESDLAANGPVQPEWSNYSKLESHKYHCHLNYRYVAC